MKIIRIISLMALGVIAVFNLAAAGPDEGFRTDINPALRYYQVMIRGPELSQADREYLMNNEWRGQKLPERFIKLISPLDSYFDELRKAGKATVPCDWGIDFTPGPATLLPHLARCKSLAQLARLRALWELQDGRETDARDDLIAAFVLGRNSSRDGTLIAALVQFAIEGIVLNSVAEDFHSFSPETLQQLAAGFDAAPAPGTTAEAVHTREMAFLHDWLEGKILGWRKEYSGDDAKVMASIRDLFRDFASDGKTNEWEAPLAAMKDSDAMLKLVREGSGQIERMGQIMALPHPAFEGQALRFQHDTDQSSNWLTKLTFPAVFKARPKEFRLDAELAMFHAAVAYKLRGEQGLREVNDPFGQGPFQFERFVFEGKDRGFKLTSAYSGNGYRQTMIFVETDGKPFICDGPKAGEPVPK